MTRRHYCHVFYVGALALFFSTTSLFTITYPFNVNRNFYYNGQPSFCTSLHYQYIFLVSSKSDPDVDGMISRWIIRKWDVVVRTGSIWLRIWTRVNALVTFGFHKIRGIT